MQKSVNLEQKVKDAIKKQPLIKKAFKAFKIKQFNKFPTRITLESTSRCNSQCITCEHKSMQRPKQDMPMALFEKIINECAQYRHLITNLNLSFIGEPLLDENIFKKIAIARKKGIKQISFICNGSLLTEEKAKNLIDSGIDFVTFSVDGASKENFEKIRVGLNYESVVLNIKRLAELKKKLGVKKPFISIDMVQLELNEAETELFKQQWVGLVDEIMVRPLHVWGGETIAQELIDYSKKLLPSGGEQRHPCFYLWKSMFILQDGKTALCCMDVEGEGSYGDVNSSSIKDVWQGKKLKKIRELHLGGEFGKIPICGRCNFYLAKGVPWWWI